MDKACVDNSSDRLSSCDGKDAPSETSGDYLELEDCQTIEGVEAEPGDVEVEESERDFNVSFVPNRTAFRLKKNVNGNILSVHHTVREGNRVIRIRLGVCCFSEHSKFVAIDKRGNIFVFDLISKHFWKLSLAVLKASKIVPHKHHENQFLVGTKMGQLFLIDVERSLVLQGCQLALQIIHEISFPSYSSSSKKLVLVHVGAQAVMVDMKSFTPTHRLDFDEGRMSLKFVCFVPQMEQIFTCFTNDAIHIWSSSTLKTVQISHPIRTRDRKMRSVDSENIRVFRLNDDDDVCNEDDAMLEACDMQNFSEGLIGAYCFTTGGGGILCLATVDKYVLLLNPRTLDLQQIIRLHDFVIHKCVFLPQPNQTVLAALTTKGKVLILDCHNAELKLLVHHSATDIRISNDGKLLAILGRCGEAEIWKTDCLFNTLVSQKQCMDILKEAFKQSKPLKLTTNECFNDDIKKLLQRDRLLKILKEYGFYPHKYRCVIWCALLKLPCNRIQFQELLRLGTQPAVRQSVEKLNIKDETTKRNLLKIWSCLAHWCKVFAYSEFFPNLILPFVKMFPKNGIVNFELIVTLLLNHFQLWFEFHPMPPADYLGMCENVLQHFDPELWQFYNKFEIKGKDFAWPLLSTSFSKVLDEEQWVILWDQIISCPLEFMIFCVASYNMLQRDVIMLLPDKITIEQYFNERNPINIHRLIKKSHALMKKCPGERSPERYFEYFHAIPRNVYPKFLRYPREWIAKQEDELLLLQREQEAIEERMRNLELRENKIITELEEGLKREEHAKRLKEMETLYYEAIKREEERVACQRKLLCLYQKEIRGLKGQTIATLNECERRKHAIEMETQLARLMNNIESERRRINSTLTLVEDEMKNQNFDSLAQRYSLDRYTYTTDLAFKFRKDVFQLTEQRNKLYQHMESLQNPVNPIFNEEMTKDNGIHGVQNLNEIERKFQEIRKEFACITKKL